MRKQSTLILVSEGEKQQTGRRGKTFTTGAVYTFANRGRAYWMPTVDWPKSENRPVRKVLPHLIPLHGYDYGTVMDHRQRMFGFTGGRGFRGYNGSRGGSPVAMPGQ